MVFKKLELLNSLIHLVETMTILLYMIEIQDTILILKLFSQNIKCKASYSSFGFITTRPIQTSRYKLLYLLNAFQYLIVIFFTLKVINNLPKDKWLVFLNEYFLCIIFCVPGTNSICHVFVYALKYFFVFTR